MRLTIAILVGLASMSTGALWSIANSLHTLASPPAYNDGSQGGSCDTDADCARKYGGTGAPLPMDAGAMQ